MSWFEVFVLSLVEGLTEFLPVSSTGHLILTSAAFGISESPLVKSFNIIIQAGAILAVVVLYWKRFFPIRWDFYWRVTLAFLPAAALGLLVKKHIDLLLGSVSVVSWALILGGFVLIWADRPQGLGSGRTRMTELTWKQCLLLGILQCLAFIPGVSRAGATLLAGLSVGLTKKEAAEFSFFLAVPTLTGASLVKGISAWEDLPVGSAPILAAGIFLSFCFAVAAIRFFIGLVEKSGLRHFGYYRIVLGAACLALWSQGVLG